MLSTSDDDYKVIQMYIIHNMGASLKNGLLFSLPCLSLLLEYFIMLSGKLVTIIKFCIAF